MALNDMHIIDLAASYVATLPRVLIDGVLLTGIIGVAFWAGVQTNELGEQREQLREFRAMVVSGKEMRADELAHFATIEEQDQAMMRDIEEIKRKLKRP
jgi:hypothetical protein